MKNSPFLRTVFYLVMLSGLRVMLHLTSPLKSCEMYAVLLIILTLFFVFLSDEAHHIRGGHSILWPIITITLWISTLLSAIAASFGLVNALVPTLALQGTLIIWLLLYGLFERRAESNDRKDREAVYSTKEDVPLE